MGSISITTAPIRKLRAHTSVAALLLAACSAPGSRDSTEAASDKAAVTAAPQGGTMILEEESLFFLQRRTLASIGAAPVVLANGDTLRVDHAASTALARHRALETQLAVSAGALLEPARTVEEFIETPDTVILLATTSMVVIDPELLQKTSPIVAGMAFKGPAARPYSSITAEERAWLNGLLRGMLLKSATHPLGAAARLGPEALWNAVLRGQGDLSITTIVEVPTGGLAVEDSRVLAPTFDGSGLDYASRTPLALPGFNTQVYQQSPDLVSDIESGTITTQSEFVNGFMQGDSFEYKEHWSFALGSLKLEAGAWYALGLRIPIDVTGVMSPALIAREGGKHDVASSFRTELEVAVIDADEDFYSRAGVPDSELHAGEELVAGGGAYVTIKLDLPTKLFDVNRTIPNHPGFDWGKSFRPPFGACGTACGFDVFIPPKFTQTKFALLDIIGGEVKLGFNVSGDGEVGVAYESLYDGDATKSTSDGQDEKKRHQLSFTETGKRHFDTPLAALTEHGESSFGYRLSDLDYDWAVKLTPAISADVFVHCSLLDWTGNLGTIYFDFASFGVGTMSFGTLSGTREEHVVNGGSKSWQADNASADYVPPNGFPVDPLPPGQHDTEGGPEGPGDDATDLPEMDPKDELDELP